ncbi:MAG TPA: hypothetical protein VNW92_15815 [Polyangiaceae bacterium]|jgi:hypothetical protein|nr:hypothetical protein [Polyangiaceae bacterium]
MSAPEAADDWTLYADHRAHFTAALLASAPAGAARLCVLGAGKCNDLDLDRLAASFSEIHLVDLDPAALAAGVSRQPATLRSRVRPHAPVDLSPLSGKRVSKWQRKPPTRAELEAAEAMTLATLLSRLPGPFDVVASACVLTQMSFALRKALGEGHPMLAAIRASIVTTHLRTLAGLTKVGGMCLLTSDLVSSTSYPLDTLRPDRSLSEVLDDVVGSGASYFAANPKLIREILHHDLQLAERAGEPEQLDPWLWTGPFERTYLVYGLRFARL